MAVNRSKVLPWITRCPVLPLREGPAAEPRTWNLLDPVNTSSFTPEEVVLPPYLHSPDVTSKLDTCPTSHLSKVQLPGLCLQGWSQLCPGGLFGQEVSKVRASGKKDKREERCSSAKFDLVRNQFFG